MQKKLSFNGMPCAFIHDIMVNFILPSGNFFLRNYSLSVTPSNILLFINKEFQSTSVRKVIGICSYIL